MQMHAHRCRCMHVDMDISQHRAQIRTHADEHKRKLTLLDEHRVNCVQCVGRQNFKTCPDVRHLFKDFPDVL